MARVHVLGRVRGDLELLLGVARLDRVRRQHPEADVLGEGVLVDHRHHGVEVHEGPLLRHRQRHDPGRRCRAANSRRASRSTPCGVVRSLIPIEHRAAAEHQDVAALGGRQAVGRALGPDVEVRVGEQRVPAVDRLVVDGLAHPGLLAHRVDRDAVVDPRRGVAGEQVVGQRRQEQVVEAERLERPPTAAPRRARAARAWSCRRSGRSPARRRPSAEKALCRASSGHRAVDPLVEGRCRGRACGPRGSPRSRAAARRGGAPARRGPAAPRRRRRAPAWPA